MFVVIKTLEAVNLLSLHKLGHVFTVHEAVLRVTLTSGGAFDTLLRSPQECTIIGTMAKKKKKNRRLIALECIETSMRTYVSEKKYCKYYREARN